jgi:elongation factor 2
LYYEVNDKDLQAHLTEEREGNGFLINLIDSPERIDFFNGVTTAVRISDGALFLVNCVTGKFDNNYEIMMLLYTRDDV